MKLKWLLAAVAFAVTTAQADPITYEGTLVSRVPVTGEVGGFSYIDRNVGQMDFWRVFAEGANRITLVAHRIAPELDPAMSFYFGQTSADGSLFDPYASFGGLTHLADADDELPSTIGPYGDPFIELVVRRTGYYTIAIGGSASDSSGLLGYTLTATVVPLPATLLLVGAGMLALGWARRSVAAPGSGLNAG